MKITINHQGIEYTFQPNNFIPAMYLSLTSITDGSKVVFDANQAYLSGCCVAPFVPDVVLAKAKNKLKTATNLIVSQTNSNLNLNSRDLEVVDFSSLSGKAIWDSVIAAEDASVTIKDKDGAIKNEKTTNLRQPDAINNYLCKDIMQSISIYSNKIGLKLTLDASDYTLAIQVVEKS